MKKITSILIILLSITYSFSQPAWTYTNTGVSHTILAQGTIPVTINGVQISVGDYVGVFYDLNSGGLACGGYSQWTGSQISVLAYQTQSGMNNGFATNEEFKWKIWRASDQNEVDADAIYLTGLPQQGNFSAGGYSVLNSLMAYTPIIITDVTIEGCPIGETSGSIDISVAGGLPPYSYLWTNGATTKDIDQLANGIYYLTILDAINQTFTNSYEVEIIYDEQEILLNSGWNIFSTYIDPVYPLLDSVFSEIINNVDIAKNYLGIVFWPQYGINNIGNISIGQAYQIKTNATDTLTIFGSELVPEQTPISVPAGWSMIGYLRIYPAPVDSMLYTIQPNIDLVKDQIGNVYWPQYGFNLIGDIEPGQGYQIKMNIADTLIYLPNIPPFSCGDQIADYDGNQYNTVQIGNQCWMQENIKVTHYADGIAIPLITSNSAWGALGDNNTDKAYCYFNNNTNSEYGALYTWAAAVNGTSGSANPSGVQGVCPTGWHMPSDDEWKQLEMQLGMSQSEADATGYRGTDQGSQLAGNSSLWNSGILENNAQFGTSEFTALPGGYRSNYNGSFYLGYNGYWWSSTEGNSSNAWYRVLGYNNSEVYRNNNYKSNGFSVRCLKDN